MTRNYEKYSSDVALENLKCSVQIDWVCTYIFAKKVTKELEVIKLAFSNFLY